MWFQSVQPPDFFIYTTSAITTGSTTRCFINSGRMLISPARRCSRADSTGSALRPSFSASHISYLNANQHRIPSLRPSASLRFTCFFTAETEGCRDYAEIKSEPLSHHIREGDRENHHLAWTARACTSVLRPANPSRRRLAVCVGPK